MNVAATKSHGDLLSFVAAHRDSVNEGKTNPKKIKPEKMNVVATKSQGDLLSFVAAHRDSKKGFRSSYADKRNSISLGTEYDTLEPSYFSQLVNIKTCNNTKRKSKKKDSIKPEDQQPKMKNKRPSTTKCNKRQSKRKSSILDDLNLHKINTPMKLENNTDFFGKRLSNNNIGTYAYIASHLPSEHVLDTRKSIYAKPESIHHQKIHKESKRMSYSNKKAKGGP